MTSRKRAAGSRSSIHRDEQQNGWSGWVSFGSDPLTGKRVRRHVRGATKNEVVDKIECLEIERRQVGCRFSDDMTVAQWMSHWLLICEHTLKSKTVDGYASHVHTHIIPNLGDIRLRDLRAEYLELALDRLTNHRKPHIGESASPATKNSVLRVISSALAVAVDRELISNNPAKRVKPFAGTDKEIEPLNREEVAKILDAIRNRRNGARWYLAFMLGLRQGEALGLKWSDIDFENGSLAIRRAIQTSPWRHGCTSPGLCGKPRHCPQRHRAPIVTTPKSNKSRRTLSLGVQTLTMLKQHRRTQAAERLQAGSLWNDEDWIFPTTVGTSISPRNDYREWQGILELAGVRKVRVHDVRHTNATALLVGGIDPRTVMELMGWSQIAMTQRYQHVVSELKREAAQRVEDYMLAPGSNDSVTAIQE